MPHARTESGDRRLITGEPSDLQIGGFVPCSSVDWPGQLAAVVFLQGCPWRCGYCHNVTLQPADKGAHRWEEVESLLSRRGGLLDGVVFSGGEPTAQAALIPATKRVHEMGFSVAVHTAGIYPRHLARVLPHVEWVALDVKALPADYAALTGADNSAERVDECLDLLAAGNVPFECRTTVDWAQLPPADLMILGERLAARGVTRFAVQIARPAGNYRPSAEARGSDDVLGRLKKIFEVFEVRA